MATLDVIDRLASLVSQRTARTDRLHESVCALLAKLQPHVEVGTRVRVGGWSLARVSQRSNIGQLDSWCLSASNTACDPSRPVGGTGYVHGDFSCPWVGPDRDDLVEFARYASQFVDALLVREQEQIEKLSNAQAWVDDALAKIHP